MSEVLRQLRAQKADAASRQVGADQHAALVRQLDELHERISALFVDIGALSESLGALPREFPEIPEVDLSPVLAMLKNQSQALVTLAQRKFPEPKEIDLSPVLEKIEAIRFPEMPERKDKWTLEVKRDQRGYIKEVVAT